MVVAALPRQADLAGPSREGLGHIQTHAVQQNARMTPFRWNHRR
jgi:hypothetical protein